MTDNQGPPLLLKTNFENLVVFDFVSLPYNVCLFFFLINSNSIIQLFEINLHA